MSTYVPIQAITLSSAAASVDLTGIPQTYTDLILVITGNNNIGTAYQNKLIFNSDTATNYSYTRLAGDGSVATSTRVSNATFGYGGWTNNTANVFLLSTNHIMNYSNSTTNKTWLFRAGDTSDRVVAGVGLWRSTAAITSIKIEAEGANTYDAGTTFTLYGVGTGSPKAFGGTTVTTDGTYWYHTFQSSGVFEPLESMTVDYLVVAGGGAGGAADSQNYGGGGGAGGLRCTVGTTGGGGSLESPLSLTSQTKYTVTVGAGGAASSSSWSSGNNSVFSTITSTGGGAGGGLNITPAWVNPQIGGSGGGGDEATTTGASGTANQGYAGGNGNSVPAFQGSQGAGGGGGGAGAVGSNGVSSTGGAGGAGVATSISGTSITYAGGGGGSGGSAGGAGGTGGGGAGSSGTPTAGTANTGGGGGSGNRSGAAGGSGIVIVRYAI